MKEGFATAKCPGFSCRSTRQPRFDFGLTVGSSPANADSHRKSVASGILRRGVRKEPEHPDTIFPQVVKLSVLRFQPRPWGSREIRSRFVSDEFKTGDLRAEGEGMMLEFLTKLFSSTASPPVSH